MKNIIVTILLLIGISNVTHAYIIQAGPRIGISSSDIKLADDIKRCYDPKMGFGYQLGAVARITLPLIYIQPELIFTMTNPKVETRCKDNPSYSFSYKKLELPILVGMRFLELLRIQAGPIFSFLIEAKDKDINITSNYKRITAGYQVGIGVDILKFLIDIKYEGSLSKFGNKLGEMCSQHRESLWILSVGINLI